MSGIFSRGPLTDYLLDLIAELTPTKLIEVGDGVAPLAGGWTGGQPGEGDFVPYVVLTTGPATKSHRETLGWESSSWSATYTLRHVGSVRQQADWCADQVRQALADIRLPGLDLDGLWDVQRLEYMNLGGITRNDSTDPPYWELTDTVSLWLEAQSY